MPFNSMFFDQLDRAQAAIAAAQWALEHGQLAEARAQAENAGTFCDQAADLVSEVLANGGGKK